MLGLFNNNLQKGNIYMNKKIISIWIGMLFLLLDTKLSGLILYPPYEPFATPAPDTVDMIIGHLIGDSVKIDIFSDIIGCFFILIPVSMIVGKSLKKRRKLLTLTFGSLTLILYIGYQLMPFVLNGEPRYQAAYFWYIILVLFKAVTFIHAGLICCELQESTQSHMQNNLAAIFIILSAFAGFIRAMSYFYELTGACGIYYAVQIFFGLLATVIYWKHQNYSKKEAA